MKELPCTPDGETVETVLLFLRAFDHRAEETV
jgi:hypothetical protein